MYIFAAVKLYGLARIYCLDQIAGCQCQIESKRESRELYGYTLHGSSFRGKFRLRCGRGQAVTTSITTPSALALCGVSIYRWSQPTIIDDVKAALGAANKWARTATTAISLWYGAAFACAWRYTIFDASLLCKLHRAGRLFFYPRIFFFPRPWPELQIALRKKKVLRIKWIELIFSDSALMHDSFFQKSNLFFFVARRDTMMNLRSVNSSHTNVNCKFPILPPSDVFSLISK